MMPTQPMPPRGLMRGADAMMQGAPVAAPPNEAGQPQPDPQQVMMQDIQKLMSDPSPENIQKFDAYYGPGSAQKIMAQAGGGQPMPGAAPY